MNSPYQPYHQAVNKVKASWGKIQVSIGKVLISSGLENQGLYRGEQAMIILPKEEIKSIFMEGFSMARDTIELTQEVEDWYEENSLYGPEEAWLNSDAEELIPGDQI